MKLSRCVADRRKFLLQLRESETVIFGSFAVQFFDRTIYQDSDLDIFFEHGDYVKALADRLTSAEGYQLACTRSGPDLEPDQEPDQDLQHRNIYDIKSIHQVCVQQLVCILTGNASELHIGSNVHKT